MYYKQGPGHQQGIQPSGPGAGDLVKFFDKSFDSVDRSLHEQTKKAPHIVLNGHSV